MEVADLADDAEFDREYVADWLGRNFSDRELARRILDSAGFNFVSSVYDHLVESLSAHGAVVLAREIVRNSSSIEEFPVFLEEVRPPPPGGR